MVTKATADKMRRLLGQGSFGRVIECECLTTTSTQPAGSLVAVKISRHNDQARGAIKREFTILKRIAAGDAQKSRSVLWFINLIDRVLTCFDSRCVHYSYFFPYKHHLCLVFPLFGVTLALLVHDPRFQPLLPHHVWQLVTQLVDGLHCACPRLIVSGPNRC